MASEIRQIATPADFAAVFDVSRETLERLATYEALLRQWQKAVNLVAPSTLDAVWHRHFADSAQILRLAPSMPTPGSTSAPAPASPAWWLPSCWRAPPRPACGERVMAEPCFQHEVRGSHRCRSKRLPLTLALSPRKGGERAMTPRVTLIESDSRKCAFLREVARRTGITVEILSTRIEAAAT